MIALLRSIVAVVVGYVIFAVPGYAVFRLSGHDPHDAPQLYFMLETVAVGIVFALAGGYVAGWISGRHPLAHAIAVATLMAIGAGVSLFMTLGHGSVWTQVAALTLMVPSAILGGWFRAPAPATALVQ